MAKVTVDEWVLKSQNRLDAVIKQAAQDLVKDAQKSRAKGGNMPVDTGFLTNSGQAAIGKTPSGGSSKANFQATAVTINRLKAGDKFVFGWTAKYARAMENRYAFVRKAVQKWPQIVKKATEKVKREVTR